MKACRWTPTWPLSRRPALRNAYEARRIAELVEAGQRVAKRHTCRKCDAECLRGDDHDTMSIKVVVDVAPVDRLGEALAIVAGLRTYDIGPQTGKTARPGAFVLYIREPWHYGCAARKYPVLVEHRCERGGA